MCTYAYYSISILLLFISLKTIHSFPSRLFISRISHFLFLLLQVISFRLVYSFSVLRPRCTKRNNGESIGFLLFLLRFSSFSHSLAIHIFVPRTGIARTLLPVKVSSAQGIPFVLFNFEPALISFSFSFFVSRRASVITSNERPRCLTIDNDPNDLATLSRSLSRIHGARSFLYRTVKAAISIVRAEEFLSRETRECSWSRVSVPFRCVSRLRTSSTCSRFVCVIRGGSSFAPGPLILDRRRKKSKIAYLLLLTRIRFRRVLSSV